MLSSIIAAVALSQGSAPPAQEVIASYPIMGKEVAALVPTKVRQRFGVDRVEAGGITYRLRNGNLVGTSRGSWADLKSQYASVVASASSATPYRVKVVVFRGSDILDTGADGVVRLRRTEVGDDEIKQAVDQVALFFAEAEIAAAGKIKVVPEVSVEEETMRFPTPGEAFASEFITRYFSPRVNGGGFDAEDKVYRGPYQAILFLHPGLTDRVTTGEVHGMAVTGLPFYSFYDAAEPQVLGNALFAEWERQLGRSLAKLGYTVPEGFAPAASWGELPAVSTLAATLPAEAWPLLATSDPAPVALPVATAGKSWAEVRSNSWANLPLLKAGDLGITASDGDSVKIGETEFRPESEGFFSAKRGSSNVVLVSPQYADLVGSNAAFKPLGILSVGSHTFVVFDGPEANGPEAQVLRLEPRRENQTVSIAMNTFEPEAAEKLEVAGYYRSKSATDLDRGSVGHIAETGRVRNGWVRLVGSDGGVAFDAAKTPYLHFAAKVMIPDPIVIRVEPADNSWPGARFELFGTVATPSDARKPNLKGQSLDVKTSTDWQNIVIDLRGGATGTSLPVAGIYIEPASGAHYWEHERTRYMNLFIDDLEVSANAGAGATPFAQTAAVTPDAKSADPEARALFAAKLQDASSAEDKAAVVALMADDNSLVRANAAAAFTRVKYPEAVAALADQARSFTARHADIGMKALAFQDTEAAWATISQCLNGPFDHNKEFAARLVATKPDRRTAGLISTLITSRSWQTRKSAAESIGSIDGQEAAIVLLTFLHEINPAVRLAATERANPNQNLASQRMEWSAVNDESDAVRAASYIKLTQSTVKGKAEEGYKGVRDDSRIVRLIILEHIRTHPNEAARTALRLAVSDTSPSVRAAALRAFATHPGEVKAEEVQNTFSDTDPRVRAALAELAAAKGVRIG